MEGEWNFFQVGHDLEQRLIEFQFAQKWLTNLKSKTYKLVIMISC